MKTDILKKYFKISILCVPIGIIVGILCFIFTYILNLVNGLRTNNPFYFIPFLFLAGLVIVFIFDKFDDKDISVKSGMKLVFECGSGKGEKIPLVLIPLVCIATWFTNLCGGSCGREGVAVQIGATTSEFFCKWVKYKRSSEIFLLSGIGAGFSAMFQTPIAGIIFAMEVITIGEYKLFALIPTVVESLVAYFTAHMLHMNIETYKVLPIAYHDINAIFIIKLLIASIAFGIIGLLFSTTIEKFKDIYSKHVKNKYIGIAISGFILSILFLALHMGRYSGTGTNLISKCFENGEIFTYDFFA